jgi:hypothetical protein
MRTPYFSKLLAIWLFAFCLLPLPISARPTARMLIARQNFPTGTRMDADLIFDIAFSLGGPT